MLPAKRTDPARALALDAVLDRLTGGPAGWSGPITRTAGSPPCVASRRSSGVCALPRHGGPAAAGGSEGSRHRAALHPPGRGGRPRAGRPSRRRHHADGVGQDALLQRAGPERHPAGPVQRGRCICFRRRRSRRTSWPSCTSCRTGCRGPTSSSIGVFTYDGDTPQDARRAIRGRAHVVLSNPDMIHSGILPHHPRWAKLFENLRYRGDRRAARVSRRVRQPPDERAAAAAPRVPALRVESDLHLLVGHDRQPARAGRGAGRGSRSSWCRKPARRAARRCSSSSTRRSSTSELGHPAVVPVGNAPHRRRSS